MTVDFKLYLITDRKLPTIPLVQAVRLVLQGGVRAIQVREKDLPVRELLAVSRELRALTREFDARLFINDQVDVAVSVEADGVHLGQQSMPVHAVRTIVGNSMLIGVSTHSLDQARTAQAEGADFITLGPIYETPSKAAFGPPVGLDVIRMVRRVVDIPIFAIGGIKGRNVGHALWAGADGVAMISAIFGAEDIQKMARNMTEMVKIVDRSICIQCGRR